MSNRSLTLPTTALRAVHSGYMDTLEAIPDPDVRDALIARTHGIGFPAFRLAVIEGRMIVGARIRDDDEVALTLSVPTDDHRDWLLFEMDEAHHGVSAEWLALMAAVEVEQGLDQLGGDE